MRHRLPGPRVAPAGAALSAQALLSHPEACAQGCGPRAQASGGRTKSTMGAVGVGSHPLEGGSRVWGPRAPHPRQAGFPRGGSGHHRSHFQRRGHKPWVPATLRAPNVSQGPRGPGSCWAPSPDRDLGRGGGDGVAAAGALEAAWRLRAGVGGKGQDLSSSRVLQWDPVPAPVVAPGSLRRGEESRLPRPLQQAATCACLSPERWARLASAEKQAEATAAQATPAPPAADPPPPAAAQAAEVVGALWRPAGQLQPRLGPRPQRGLSPPPVVCPPRVQAAPLLEARLLRGPGIQRLPRTYFHCITLPTRVWAIGKAGGSGDHGPRPSRGARSLRRCVLTAECAGLETSACTRPSAL